MHDKLFRDLLNNKEEMKDFLNKYLKLEINLEDLEKYNSSFITNKYQNKESDIVYKLKNKNIFFLIEHQSKVDKTMLLRLMEYSVEIIRGEIENDRNDDNGKVQGYARSRRSDCMQRRRKKRQKCQS